MSFISHAETHAQCGRTLATITRASNNFKTLQNALLLLALGRRALRARANSLLILEENIVGLGHEFILGGLAVAEISIDVEKCRAMKQEAREIKCERMQKLKLEAKAFRASWQHASRALQTDTDTDTQTLAAQRRPTKKRANGILK